MPNIRKHPKEFRCQQCYKYFPNRKCVAVLKYCSQDCYKKSDSFMTARINGGKASLGRKIDWGHKISEAKLGQPRYNMRKEKHPNWKGGITHGRIKEMSSLEHKNWRRAVFERDGYACQICGDKNGNGKSINLVAHHKAPWHKYPEFRYDIENGMTLCAEDHLLGHQLFGYDY